MSGVCRIPNRSSRRTPTPCYTPTPTRLFMAGRNGPIAAAAKLTSSARLLAPGDQVLILKAAGLLLGEYATSAVEKAAVQAFQNRDRIGAVMQEALVALEDRGQFNASE